MKIIQIESWPQFSTLAVQRESGKWLFRGVPQSDYELIARAGRPRSQSHPFDYVEEQKALLRFRRAARPYLGLESASMLEWMSVAQHHGLPTRLLDWSESPFVALFFAVLEGKPRHIPMPNGAQILGVRDAFMEVLRRSNQPLSDEEPKSVSQIELIPTYPSSAAVYAVSMPPEISDSKVRSDSIPTEPSIPVEFYQPVHLTPRITVQRAVHTVHYKPEIPWEPVDGEKWLIPPELIFEFKLNLNVVGFNDATLFPDLDGIGRYFDWLYWRNM